jgi:hypothetical protein
MAVLGIAIVFGVLVFLAEYNRVGSLVADRAQRSVALFNAQTQHLLERPGLLNAAEFQKTLEATAGQSRGQAIGRFVSVEITGAGTLRLAELRDPDYAHSDEVESYMQSPSQRVPQQDEDYYETIDIGGADHVYVVVPMRNSNGEVAAYARGVFALSEAAFAQIYRRIATVVGATIAVIIVTSLLLYPIIARLLSQVSLLSTRLLDANLEMIEVLGSAIAKRDSDTDVHNYRVTIYSVRLAEAIDLDRQSIRSLIKGAFLHDVGKIGISDNILLKPGRLDPGIRNHETARAARPRYRRALRVAGGRGGDCRISPYEIRRQRLPRSLGRRGNSAECADLRDCRRVRCADIGAPLQEGVRLRQGHGDSERRQRDPFRSGAAESL